MGSDIMKGTYIFGKYGSSRGIRCYEGHKMVFETTNGFGCFWRAQMEVGVLESTNSFVCFWRAHMASGILEGKTGFH